MIKETKRANADKIIYVAIEDEGLIKDIYYRKADSRNDDIELRNFIPPQLHARFMTLNRACADMRLRKTSLKTQIRFGKADLEVFTKTKGEEGPYRKADIEDFIEQKMLPKYDHSIKWKILTERKTKRTIDYSKRRVAPPSLGEGRGQGSASRKEGRQIQTRGPAVRQEANQMPATGKRIDILPAIIRQHSNTSENKDNKKLRTTQDKELELVHVDTEDMEDDDEDDEDEDEDQEEEEEDPVAVSPRHGGVGLVNSVNSVHGRN